MIACVVSSDQLGVLPVMVAYGPESNCDTPSEPGLKRDAAISRNTPS